MAIFITFLGLVCACGLTLFRLLKGPSLPDRIVALELLTSGVMGLIAAYTMIVKEFVFLDVIGVLALVSFLATVAYTQYLEREEQNKLRGEDRV